MLIGSYEDWKAEHKYITGIDKLHPGKSFNDDPLCFARYCTMQAKAVEKAGFPLIASDIMNHRDTILQLVGKERIDFENETDGYYYGKNQ